MLPTDIYMADPAATKSAILTGGQATRAPGVSAINPISGTSGADRIAGTSGDDVIAGNEGNDVIAGNQGNDFLLGNTGDDFLLGNNGNDTLRGGRDNDILYGGGDDDMVYGDLGDDFLSGDRGNDMLYGGTGADTFYYGAANQRVALDAGHDRTGDFELKSGGNPGDMIQLEGLGSKFDTYAEVMQVAQQTADGVVFDFGNGRSLTVEHVQVADLTSDYFII